MRFFLALSVALLTLNCSGVDEGEALLGKYVNRNGRQQGGHKSKIAMVTIYKENGSYYFRTDKARYPARLENKRLYIGIAGTEFFVYLDTEVDYLRAHLLDLIDFSWEETLVRVPSKSPFDAQIGTCECEVTERANPENTHIDTVEITKNDREYFIKGLRGIAEGPYCYWWAERGLFRFPDGQELKYFWWKKNEVMEIADSTVKVRCKYLEGGPAENALWWKDLVNERKRDPSFPRDFDI